MGLLGYSGLKCCYLLKKENSTYKSQFDMLVEPVIYFHFVADN